MGVKKQEETATLAQWIIAKTDTEKYRAGTLTGWKHPKVDAGLLKLVGGRLKLVEQARDLEKNTEAGRSGKLKFDWSDVNTDIRRVNYDVSIIPELCRLEKKEDARERQLRLLSVVRSWREDAADCAWLCDFYDELTEHLAEGKKADEAEDEQRFLCINAVAKQSGSVWERVFSARVFNDSKKFKNCYKEKIVTILRKHSPYYVDGMSNDELLGMHGIHSYAQTLEWKGPLQYKLDGQNVIDTSAQRYGTVLNTQTMEHAAPCCLPGCKKIMTIENKANYEDMSYRDDTLYIFCHGFFTPKETKFLRELCAVVPKECEFFHWGDMDFGGISIFLFIKETIFPELLPYKMGVENFAEAVKQGGGIPLKEETRARLEKKDAGILNGLKEVILQTNLTIEQERLLQPRTGDPAQSR